MTEATNRLDKKELVKEITKMYNSREVRPIFLNTQRWTRAIKNLQKAKKTKRPEKKRKRNVNRERKKKRRRLKKRGKTKRKWRKNKGKKRLKRKKQKKSKRKN